MLCLTKGILRVTANSLVIEHHDVKPRKGFLPILTPGIYRRPTVCLQIVFDATRKRCAVCIWRTHLSKVCCCSLEPGGLERGESKGQRILQRELKDLTIQSRPLEGRHSELPNPGNVGNGDQTQHKSDSVIRRSTV